MDSEIVCSHGPSLLKWFSMIRHVGITCEKIFLHMHVSIPMSSDLIQPERLG